MIKPLLRTIPSMSGNVKLACTLLDYNKIKEDTFETNIRGAHLLPLSSSLFQKSVTANLLNSSWEYDLKKFYTAYSDTFFDTVFPISVLEMPILDETQIFKNRNTDLEYGVKRVSYDKSGCQFACFAPIYIDDPKDIPSYFLLKMEISAKRASITKYIKVNIASNAKSNYNYIYKYLNKYLSNIDDNVAYMNNVDHTVTYYGIDLLNGGFTKTVDATVSSLFNIQMPIQMFDNTLSIGFERNRICMRQSIPLCFYFNVQDVLNSVELEKFKFGTVVFSGNYYDSNDNKIDWYDYDWDYDFHAEDILAMNELTGIMSIIPGYEPNIMDAGFPSFNDTRLTQYQFANKLSISFTRWKLKYSSDEWPYITNMSWAFSNNQDSNYKYREYPSAYLQQAGFAYINDNLAYDLIFPLGTDKEKYDKINSRSASKYKAIMDNYCLNWFDVITDTDVKSNYDAINWADVNEGYAYFNSVLYNLNAIYNKMQYPDKVDKIDKFAVLLYPNTSEHIYEEDFIKDEIMFVGNAIEYSRTGSESTVSVDPDILDNVANDVENYTLYKQNAEYNAGIKFDQLFVELDDADYNKFAESEDDTVDGTPIYVNAHDLGIEYHDLNAYAKVRDVFGNSGREDKLGIYTSSNWKYTFTKIEDKLTLTRGVTYKFGDTDNFFTSITNPQNAKPNEYLTDTNYQIRKSEFIKTLYKLFTGESLSSDIDLLTISDDITVFINIINNKIKELFGDEAGFSFIENDNSDNRKTIEEQFESIIDAFVCASFTDASNDIYLPKDIFTEAIGFKAYEQLNVYKGTLLTDTGSEINQKLVDYSVNLQYKLPEDARDGAQPIEMPSINSEDYYVEQFTRKSPLYINSNMNVFVPELVGSKPTVIEVPEGEQTKLEFDIKPVVVPNTEEIANTYSNMLYLYDWFINGEAYSTDYKSMYDDIECILDLTTDENKQNVKYILDQDILNNYISTDTSRYGLPYLKEPLNNYTKSLFFNMELVYAVIYETIKKKILDKLSQKLNRSDQTTEQHSELYLYHPLLNYNKTDVGRNVMIKKGLRYDECTDDVIYADEFKDEEGNVNYNIDDDVLYVHPYNMHNLLELIYGENYIESADSSEAREEFMSYIETSTLYGKVVDMTYLKRMSSISASGEEADFGKVSIPFNRSFYEQYKVFELDDDGQMTVRFMYVDFKDIMKKDGEDDITDDVALQRYIEQINVFDDPEKGAFCREFNYYASDEKTSHIVKRVYFNIVEKTEFIKLDDKLWELANVDNETKNLIYALSDNDDSNYIDLFIYRPIKDIEFDEKYYNTLSTAYIDDTLTYYNQVIVTTDANSGEPLYLDDTKVIDNLRLSENTVFDGKYKVYLSNLIKCSGKESVLEDTDTMLYPCFNSAFIQDKEDTVFYKNYCLNNISKVDVYFGDGTIKNYYRYNENNAALFITVTADQYNRLTQWFADNVKDERLKLYKKLHETNSVSYYTDAQNTGTPNDQYSKFNMNTFSKDGTTYGYYIIEVDVNNTSDLFDIRGLMDTDENSSNVAEIDQIQNLKYITYVNGIDITTDEGKKYLQTIFKQLCPFLYINILSITSQIQTMMSPTAFNLTTTYASKQTSTSNGSAERTLIYTKQTITSAKKQILQRYTNAIVPYIKKCNIINNQYNYKFKDMNVSLIDTGKFNSIGDTVIYKDVKIIDEKSSYNVYGFTDAPKQHSYNNVIYTYTPIEHKDYNRSEMINLPLSISIKAARPYAYHELMEVESDEVCIKVFKDYVSSIREFENNNQILFLYNKYKVSFKTSAIGVTFDNTEKVYTLEYKFNLL